MAHIFLRIEIFPFPPSTDKHSFPGLHYCVSNLITLNYAGWWCSHNVLYHLVIMYFKDPQIS